MKLLPHYDENESATINRYVCLRSFFNSKMDIYDNFLGDRRNNCETKKLKSLKY